MNNLKTILATTSFVSALGLRPIWSTKNTESQPATLGKQAEEILNDNFSTLDTEVVKKVYKSVIYNLTQATGITYTDKTTARNAVPVNFRGLDQIIVYRLSTGTITEQFNGTDVSEWTADSNWDLIIDAVSTTESNNLLAFLDKIGNVLFRVDPEGKMHVRLADYTVNYEALSVEVRNILNGLQAVVSTSDNEKYISVLLDAENRIIEGVQKDGVRYVEKLKVGQFVETELNTPDTGSISNQEKAQIARPMSLPVINIVGTLPATKGVPLKVKMEFENWGIAPFVKWAEIDIQGRSSVAHPKKNYSIDLFNDEALTSAFSIKIGDWVYQDSFHMKANYTNITQANNVACANIAFDAFNTHPIYRRRAWLTNPYNEADNDLYRDYDLSARGVIDGFAVKILHNGEFHGHYTFNLKKHRANFHMGKDNKANILLDPANAFSFAKDFDYTEWELRNPKIKGYVENGEITDQTVVNSLNRFFSWTQNVTADNIRDTASDYLDIEYNIDYALIVQFIGASDNTSSNGLLGSWDGLRWTLNLYDLDQTCGFVGWTPGTYRFIAPSEIIQFNNGFTEKLLSAYQTEVKQRYAELRDSKVFSVERVECHYRRIMDAIGYDGYKEELSKWNDTPSYTEVKDSLPRVLDWFSKRIPALDTYYSYNP